MTDNTKKEILFRIKRGMENVAFAGALPDKYEYAERMANGLYEKIIELIEKGE